MLLELKVSDFAVIESMRVNFLRPGLNVLSGETGAGKSVLIKSLVLLTGGKASTDVVRAGCETAVVEGAFDLSGRKDVIKKLSGLGFDVSEPLLVVKRIVSKSGKHRIYLNGSLATLNMLGEVMPLLVEVTGQHENQSLHKRSVQLEYLDMFAATSSELSDFERIFDSRAELENQLSELLGQNQNREMRMDFLRFQVNEIDEFGLKDTDDSLEDQIKSSANFEKLSAFEHRLGDFLNGNDQPALGVVGQLSTEAARLTNQAAEFSEVADSLREARKFLDLAFKKTREATGAIDLDEETLAQNQTRIERFKKLQRKYGLNVQEIKAFREKAFSELENLENFEARVQLFGKQIDAKYTELKKIGDKLSLKRKKASEKLSDLVNKELADLNMKSTIFSIGLKNLESAIRHGFDEVEFLIQTSAKDTPRSIHKIASGGEMSRLTLALKQVVSKSELPKTYLFDEVDAGVSGPTAEKIGRKLKNAGRRNQVVSITHLPQVAAFADAHFLIQKEIVKGVVKSEVLELNHKQRTQELARMISGEKVTKASLVHAEEMLQELS